MKKTAQLIIILIDYILLIFSLVIVLWARTPASIVIPLIKIHLFAFLPLFAFWILIFSLFDLYNLNFPPRIPRFFFCIATCVIVSSFIFYILPVLVISPKTNLFLIGIISTVLIIVWRRLFDFVFVKKLHGHEIMISVSNQDSFELVQTLKKNHRHKYKIIGVLSNKAFKHKLEKLVDKNIIFTDVLAFEKTLAKNDIKTVVCSDWWFPQLYTSIYNLLPRTLHMVNIITFYETVFGYIPIHSTSQYWIITNMDVVSRRTYEFIKRTGDILFAIVMGLFVTPLCILTAISITLFGKKGPVFFTQVRVGKNNKPFTLIKFRTMHLDAEKDGAQWASKNDPRITKLGKFLRQTRLDELPQIWNVLKGEMSFIGPRPERPVFIKELSEKIPHYQLRHMVKPGLSGWAQVKFKYTDTVETTATKVCYDLFYVKRMNFILDVQIFFHTIAIIISAKGQ